MKSLVSLRRAGADFIVTCFGVEGTAGAGLGRRLGFVEFGEDIGEGDADGGAGIGEDVFGRAKEAVDVPDVASELPRIDGHDVLDTHSLIVVDPLLKFAERIVFRENFNAEEGWDTHNGVGWVGGADDTDVRDTVMGG